MDPSLRRKIVVNTVSVVLARSFGLVVGLLLTPFILGWLGNEVYGIWVFVAVFAGFLGIADLGFGISFTKYIAEYNAADNSEDLNGVFTAGLALYSLWGLIIIVVAGPLIDLFIQFLSIPSNLHEDAQFALWLGVLVLVIRNLIRVMESVTDGLQRMDITNGISAFFIFLTAIFYVVFLEKGYGIRGLMICQLVMTGGEILVKSFFAYRLYPRLKINITSARNKMSTLFRFGLNLQVTRIAILVNLQFDKLLVTKVIDITYGAFYDIGGRFAFSLRSMSLMLLSALVPSVSELGFSEGKERVYGLFSTTSKYITFVVLPGFVGLMVLAFPLIQSWVGPGYESSAMILTVLGAGYMFKTLSGPVSPMVEGMGKPEIQRKAETLNLCMNIVLSVVLIHWLGYLGPAIGTALSMAITCYYYLWSFHQFMEQPLAPYIKRTFNKPFLATLIAGGLAFLVMRAIGYDPTGGRWGALWILFTAGSLFTICYVYLIFKFQYLEKNEIQMLKESLPPVRWICERF